jgi:hypothetical protein
MCHVVNRVVILGIDFIHTKHIFIIIYKDILNL